MEKYHALLTGNTEGCEDYFDDLTKNLPIKCGFTGAAKGKAIFARHDIKKGQCIFRETPYVAMQHLENKANVNACSHCFKLLSKEDSDCFACECGEKYCSSSCQAESLDQYHQLLCPKDLESPMNLFLEHAAGTNEIFILAAKVVCKIIMKYIKFGNLEIATKPFDMFCKLPWPDVIACSAELEEGQTLAEYLNIFSELLNDTAELLKVAIAFNLKHHFDLGKYGLNIDQIMKEECGQRVLTPSFFSRIVGMFELNNISIEIYENIVPAEQSCSNEEEDEILADGTALFSLICTMNHSCEPNCNVFYREDYNAIAIANTDIQAGEEICISYIDEDEDYEDRQTQLREYQFQCQCKRCLCESAK